MGGDKAVVAADHLDGDPEAGEVGDGAGGIGLGRVLEEEKAAEGHLCLVLTVVIGAGREAAGGEGEDAQALGAQAFEAGRERGAASGVERAVGRAFAHRDADREHLGEGALGDHLVIGRARCRGDDGQAAADEVVGDLVDLDVAGGREAGRGTRRHERGVERVLDPRLEAGVEEGEFAHAVRACPCAVERALQDDVAFGQRAGLVGAEDGHAAEVFDRVEAAHDHAAACHGAGAGREGDADDRGQKLG